MASGGKREGAGRPAPLGKRVSVSVRILPRTKEMLRYLKGKGFNFGQWIDEAISEEFLKADKM